MKLRSRRRTSIPQQMAGRPKKQTKIGVGRPPRGLCRASAGSVEVQHHAFGKGVKHRQKRMSALARSFAIPGTIRRHDDIKKRVIRDMVGVCTDIPRGYPEGIVEWVSNIRGSYNFDHLTTIHVSDKFVGFITLTNSTTRRRSTNVLLLCAKPGCGGYLYDLSEKNAIYRGFNHITLDSVVDKYGFYRKKGFRCSKRDNLPLDHFWDDVMNIPPLAGDDGSEEFLMKLPRAHSAIPSKLEAKLGKDLHSEVLEAIFQNITRGHLLNVVIQMFKGSADAFLKHVEYIDVNPDFTITMEKDLVK